MANEGSTYRHYIPALDLFIERGTSRVPGDGKYHVVYKGKIVGSFRSRKKAEQKFRQLVEESGYKPDTSIAKPVDPSQEALERYSLEKAIFWAEGPKYKGKGGRGGRGGV
jgi:hypothetical protein